MEGKAVVDIIMWLKRKESAVTIYSVKSGR
jgi:hypothetical protein